MKKLIALALLLTLSLTLVCCKSSKYPAKKSTAEESKVVMTLSLDGERYDIKYELYRALFYAHHKEIDGGDTGIWQGADKQEYINEINEKIISSAAKIYSAFHIAEKIGVNLYSKDSNAQVEEYVRVAVEGNGADILGYDGDYDAYLADLAKIGINYSVQDLLFRYSIATEKINEYYIGVEDEALGFIDGDYEYSTNDVREFYFSDDSVRVLEAYIQGGYIANAEEKINSLKDAISSLSPIDAALYIINHTAVIPLDLIQNKKVSGTVFGSYTLDEEYSALSEAAFALSPGEVSDVIAVNEVGATTYYVLYGLEKSDEHFSECFDDIKMAYLNNLVSKMLLDTTELLSENVTTVKGYSEINHSEIIAK